MRTFSSSSVTERRPRLTSRDRVSVSLLRDSYLSIFIGLLSSECQPGQGSARVNQDVAQTERGKPRTENGTQRSIGNNHQKFCRLNLILSRARNKKATMLRQSLWRIESCDTHTHTQRMKRYTCCRFSAGWVSLVLFHTLSISVTTLSESLFLSLLSTVYLCPWYFMSISEGKFK